MGFEVKKKKKKKIKKKKRTKTIAVSQYAKQLMIHMIYNAPNPLYRVLKAQIDKEV